MAADKIELGFGSMGPPGESQRFAREYFLNTVIALEPRIALTLTEGGRNGLHHWARRWHLTDPWILEVAEFTLTVYDEDIKVGGPLEFDRFAWPLVDEVDFGNEVAPTFYPDSESEKKYIQRVKDHIAKQKSVAEAAGLRPLDRHDKSRPPFEWLAKHQCLEIGFTDIARQRMEAERVGDLSDEDSVKSFMLSTRQAIRDLSDYIVLTLRTSPRGPESHTHGNART